MWRRKVSILREEQLKQAIKDSIQTEKDAMDFYRLAGEKMYNERPRLTFKLLAHEEREHARSFYEAYSWDDLPGLFRRSKFWIEKAGRKTKPEEVLGRCLGWNGCLFVSDSLVYLADA